MDILREYLALCWLSNDPLELPRSESLFKKSLVLYFLIGYLLQANMIDDPIEAFYEITIQIVSMLLFIGIMLSLNKTLYLYVQITTAFMLSANVISVFVVPVMVWLTVSEDMYSYYLFFLLLAWYFAIVAYIIKYTLVINIPASMVLSLFYFIATFVGAFALGQVI
jgi:hypothetical protein